MNSRNGLAVVFAVGVALGSANSLAQPAPAPLRPNLQALHQGRVTAIRDNLATTITVENAQLESTRASHLVERLPVRPQQVQLPPALAQGLPPGRTATKLNYRVVTRKSDLAAPVDLDVLVMNGSGLMLHGGHRAYAGNFFVALVDTNAPNERTSIAGPIPISITATGATSVAPRPLLISALATWHEASLVVPAIDAPSYRVALSAIPGDEGAAIELPVVHPTIEIVPSSAVIFGWGIGSTTVSFVARNMISPQGYTLTVANAGRGSLDSQIVTLDAAGHGSVNLRSSMGDGAMISAGAGSVQSQPVRIVFEAPWVFFAFAGVGGLVGAFIRGPGREKWTRALMLGIASGVLAASAYFVGFDWPARVLKWAGAPRSGEISVFVLAALAALLGSPVVFRSAAGATEGGTTPGPAPTS